METRTKNAEETIMLGERIGKSVAPGTVIALFGDLGAGKTTLTQGIAKGLGITDYVTSPSFIIISEFKGRIDLCHIDLYRLEGEGQVEDLGMEEYLLKSNTVFVIEWAEKMGSMLPADSVKIKISTVSDNERKISIEGMKII